MGLRDHQIERLANADIDDRVRLEGLDLQKLRQEIGRRAIEHDRLDLEPEVLLLVLLLGFLGEADAVVGGLGDDGHPLPLVLLDPAEPGGRARRIDRMGAEGDVVFLGGDVAGACLGAHGRHAHLLGHLVDGDVDTGMDEAEHGNGLLARHQPAVGGDALLVLAGAVMDRQRDLASEHAALLVDVLDADLGAALGKLAQRRLARRRQRRDQAEHHRLLLRYHRRKPECGQHREKRSCA